MIQAIVSGSTGFIGSHFVEHLLGQGVDVLALGRRTLENVSSEVKDRICGATYLRLDMSEIASLDEALSQIGWDVEDGCVFFNFAWGGEKRLSDLNVDAQLKNVGWSVSAFDLAAKIGCDRFVQVGTMEESFTQRYLELDHRKNDEYNRHVVYSVSKMAAKKALKVRAAQSSMGFIYAINSHVMGPGDDKDSFLQVTLKKLIDGDELVFSTGEQYFDVVSTADCAHAYYLIGERGQSNAEYWVGSGTPLRLREYVERMYALFPSGKEMQFGALPYRDIVLDREKFSIKKLAEHTGYKPEISYEQMVCELYDHLKNSKE